MTTDQSVAWTAARDVDVMSRACETSPPTSGLEVETRFSAVLLDCDGVLVDTEPVWFELICELLAERGLPTSLFCLADFCGKPLHECVDVISSRLGQPLDAQFCKDFRQRTSQLPASAFRAVHGASAMLSALVAAGRIALAVVSNSPLAQVRRSLSGAGLGDFFPVETLTCGPEVGSYKPDSTIHRLAAARIGVPIEACIVVEDSPLGMIAGRDAGATVLGYAEDPSQSCVVEGVHPIRALHDVLDFLELPGYRTETGLAES